MIECVRIELVNVKLGNSKSTKHIMSVYDNVCFLMSTHRGQPIENVIAIILHDNYFSFNCFLNYSTDAVVHLKGKER